MQTCKTCKWWLEVTDRQLKSMAEQSLSLKCECGVLNAKGGDDGIRFETEWPWDGEEWFVTGPDFGCIHHEEKA